MARGFKTGGRQAGQPNKLTAELREILSDIIREELEALPERLNELETKDRLVLLEKFTAYVLPKMESANERSQSEPVIIQISDKI
jgi:hypothetical protein